MFAHLFYFFFTIPKAFPKTETIQNQTQLPLLPLKHITHASTLPTLFQNQTQTCLSQLVPPHAHAPPTQPSHAHTPAPQPLHTSHSTKRVRAGQLISATWAMQRILLQSKVRASKLRLMEVRMRVKVRNVPVGIRLQN